MNSAVARPSPEQLRADLAARLSQDGWIRTSVVGAAFRAVPRHLFVPDTVTMADAYADTTVAAKRDPNGKTTSSVSAPWVQAYMLEQAGLRPGARVLEIGTSGYNAALLAEIVGPDGTVVTLDIDPDVIGRTRAGLNRAGYVQVEVFCADGEYGYRPAAPYDAIIVTVETTDAPPAWLDQLAPDGVLVLPLRMRGITRCLTLRRRGDHLAASAALQCGFVAMQGDGRSPARRIFLRGDDVVLLLDDDTTDVDRDGLVAALHLPRVEAWSPVTISMREDRSFESLHLWLASQPRPFGVLAVNRERTVGLVDPQDRFTCPPCSPPTAWPTLLYAS
jgi:protein-L-isoaspartate(D-aspartate) O-methyltransferase